MVRELLLPAGKGLSRAVAAPAGRVLEVSLEKSSEPKAGRYSSPVETHPVSRGHLHFVGEVQNIADSKELPSGES